MRYARELENVLSFPRLDIATHPVRATFAEAISTLDFCRYTEVVTTRPFVFNIEFEDSWNPMFVPFRFKTREDMRYFASHFAVGPDLVDIMDKAEKYPDEKVLSMLLPEDPMVYLQTPLWFVQRMQDKHHEREQYSDQESAEDDWLEWQEHRRQMQEMVCDDGHEFDYEYFLQTRESAWELSQELQQLHNEEQELDQELVRGHDDTEAEVPNVEEELTNSLQSMFKDDDP